MMTIGHFVSMSQSMLRFRHHPSPCLLWSKHNSLEATVSWFTETHWNTMLILGLRPANAGQRYFVPTSRNDWAQALNRPWNNMTSALLRSARFFTTLTHWGRDKMAAISQTTLSSAFSWKKMSEFGLKFHWSLFIRVHSMIFQHWFR